MYFETCKLETHNFSKRTRSGSQRGAHLYLCLLNNFKSRRPKTVGIITHCSNHGESFYYSFDEADLTCGREQAP